MRQTSLAPFSFRLLPLLLLLLLSLLPLISSEELPPSCDPKSLCEPPLENLLEWGVKNRIISPGQKEILVKRHAEFLFAPKAETLPDVNPPSSSSSESTETASPSHLSSLVARLTLLNVLYFAGGLLVIGSMTLFMTLGWENFGGKGLFLIASLYSTIFGAAGLATWASSPEHRMLGGILCTISVSMAPLATYGLQRALNWWVQGNPGTFQDFRVYVRGSWIPMDLATVAMGTLYLLFIPFPFLLAPVSAALWFLSMDLVPVLAGRGFGWAERLEISTWFGLGMMIAAQLVETRLGRTPDFGFWLHVFGLLAFWTGISFQGKPRTELNVTLYGLVNLSLVLLGRLLLRDAYLLAGMAGLVLSLGSLLEPLLASLRRGARPPNLHLTALGHVARMAVPLLLVGSCLRHGGSLVELIPAALGLATANVVYVFYLLGQGEPFHLLHLLCNLGVAFVAPELPGSWGPFILQLISFAGAATFHASAITVATSLSTGRTAKFLFYLYRIGLCLGLSFLPQLLLLDPSFLHLSFLGLLGAAILVPRWIILAFSPSFLPHPLARLPPFFTGLLLSHWATYFSHSLGFTAGVLLSFATLQWLMTTRFKGLSCQLAVLLLLLSVPYDSSLMATTATLIIFFFLSDLAYRVFKNSLLFPLFLTLLGIAVIGLGVLYQRNIEFLQGLVVLPASSLSLFIQDLLASPMSPKDFELLGEIRSFSLASFSLPTLSLQTLSLLPLDGLGLRRLLLSGACAINLVKNTPEHSTLVVVFGTVLLLFATNLLETLNLLKKISPPPLCSEVVLESVRFAQDTQNHGVILRIKGTKPANLQISQVKLTLEGDEIWEAVAGNIPPLVISMARSIFLPLKLCPQMLTPADFNRPGTGFQVDLRLGTKEPRVLHTTIQDQLKNLERRGNPSLVCSFRISTGWFSTRELFRLEMKPASLLRMLRA